MPVLEARKHRRVEAPAVANAGRGSKLKAPVAPGPPKKNSRTTVLAATKVLNPQDFVCIQALPGFSQKEGKVMARSRTIYKSSELPREQVFWESYYRRQKQFTQGHFTPLGKPYQELGEVLYTDPKKLTLYSLGQLAQEPVKKEGQEKTPKEAAEVTTDEDSFNAESDPLEPVKRLSPFKETEKELRTLSKALAHSRHHVNSVKQGGEYFHILHQESLERKNTLKAAQQAQGTRWRSEFQPPKYSSAEEESEEEINTSSLIEDNPLRKSGKKKKKMTWSFTPVYTSVLIPSPPGAKSEHLFRQLCAIHWLLEALTLESNSSMHSILTCWNPRDPGGWKKTVKETEEKKLATYMWELFITNTKKWAWKARYNPLSRKINKISTPHISQLSSQSSPRGQTPRGSETSTVLCSEDNIKVNVASLSKSAQAKEQPPLFPSLQKVTQITREEVSKDVHKQEDVVKKIGLQRLLPVAQKNYRVNMPFVKDQESILSRKQRPRRQGCRCHIGSFIKSKSNLRADMRQKFTAVREEAACRLHDTLVTLERRQEDRCYQKYEALKQLKYFRRDMERIRRLSTRSEREHDEGRLNWFPVLLARLPESVKSDHYVQKILKKLEKYGKSPDLKIHPDTFLKALANLQVWELCSPEVAAAVEFVRESIVQMPEEDFSKWFQTRVAPLSAQSSTF
ncbi:coiled-coil domain-containing protein 60 isoform X2 [Athene cunicularia]|uniref:coiled-coil domain-containing protein 60 isoform X2 n=1 Tax=Athene cunicularia TaxID=194338 RepID=UPI000EF72D9C|nr:coiled-coil domain-containing protein 60 isoform X2 [Athene cunicularia]